MSSAVVALRRSVQWLREHPLAGDSILGVALTAMALIVHFSAVRLDAEDPIRAVSWWTPLPLIAATLPIIARRRWPIATLLVVFGAQATCELLDIAGSAWLAVLLAFYSVGAHTEGRRRLVGVAAVASMFGGLMISGVGADEVTVVDAVATLGLCTAALVLGDNVRRRRQHMGALAERAERAERERDLLARERVAEERNRIARDLHDIVAHSVSVMVLQAAAARRNLAARPEATPDLLANIERTGRQTMDELRHVLGVLRDPERDGVEPLPTLGDVEALVDTYPGLRAHVEVSGPTHDVPAGVGLAAYRVVQEALTNAHRHAGPYALVDVRVTCAPSQVEVLVEDDGRGAAAKIAAPGYGLVGMNERVAATGGTLTAGPRPGGGWRVTARLPMPAAVGGRHAELVS